MSEGATMTENVPILTGAQRRGVAALLTSKTRAEAAVSARVTVRTLARWMHDPAFVAALHQAEAAALSEAGRWLVRLAQKALEAVEGVLDDKDAPAWLRMQAAQTVLAAVLRWRELTSIEERLAALEEAQSHDQGS